MIRLRSLDWRILLGIVITTFWLVGGLLYFLGQDQAIWDIPIENLGSFLEGGFAPLAFLWLVIGLFVQQKELSDNTEVMRQSTRLSERQAEVLAASELSTRQQAFFTIADNVKRQLGSIAGMLFISRFGGTEGDIVSSERIGEMWQGLSTGDAEVFPRGFLGTTLDDYGGSAEVFYGSEIRARHSHNYMSTFLRLLDIAQTCDADGVITGTITHTAHGILFNIMFNALAEAEAKNLIDLRDYAHILEHGTV